MALVTHFREPYLTWNLFSEMKFRVDSLTLIHCSNAHMEKVSRKIKGALENVEVRWNLPSVCEFIFQNHATKWIFPKNSFQVSKHRNYNALTNCLPLTFDVSTSVFINSNPELMCSDSSWYLRALIIVKEYAQGKSKKKYIEERTLHKVLWLWVLPHSIICPNRKKRTENDEKPIVTWTTTPKEKGFACKNATDCSTGPYNLLSPTYTSQSTG